ncbi:MAG: hypothetical protein JST65_24170 [Acidobacteria bacterium]|nr:hypothetical protein [Acidobacteriota bacterium]
MDLPPEVEETLSGKARAANVPVERYTIDLVTRALAADRNADEMETFLNQMARNAPIQGSEEELEAAIEEALAAVRPKRIWK